MKSQELKELKKQIKLLTKQKQRLWEEVDSMKDDNLKLCEEVAVYEASLWRIFNLEDMEEVTQWACTVLKHPYQPINNPKALCYCGEQKYEVKGGTVRKVKKGRK